MIKASIPKSHISLSNSESENENFKVSALGLKIKVNQKERRSFDFSKAFLDESGEELTQNTKIDSNSKKLNSNSTKKQDQKFKDNTKVMPIKSNNVKFPSKKKISVVSNKIKFPQKNKISLEANKRRSSQKREILAEKTNSNLSPVPLNLNDKEKKKSEFEKMILKYTGKEKDVLTESNKNSLNISHSNISLNENNSEITNTSEEVFRSSSKIDEKKNTFIDSGSQSISEKEEEFKEEIKEKIKNKNHSKSNKQKKNKKNKKWKFDPSLFNKFKYLKPQFPEKSKHKKLHLKKCKISKIIKIYLNKLQTGLDKVVQDEKYKLQKIVKKFNDIEQLTLLK